MSSYRKDFYETKFMFFLIKDDELLEKYNEIWEKNKESLKKDFDSEPVCNGKINTNFHINKIAKQHSQYICLSVFRTGKNYYSQVFLEECKYAVKGNKIPK